MMRRGAVLIFWLLGVAGFVLDPGSAGATSIQYQATELSASQNTWEYTYAVSGFVFPVNSGFSVHFDPTLYSMLANPPPAVNSDWNVISLQPDSNLPADGLYDALALKDSASLQNPFTVSFVWKGAPGTTPGVQVFDVNQFDTNGNLIQQLETGTTTPVPEPDSVTLIGIGLALGAIGQRHRRARS